MGKDFLVTVYNVELDTYAYGVLPFKCIYLYCSKKVFINKIIDDFCYFLKKKTLLQMHYKMQSLVLENSVKMMSNPSKINEKIGIGGFLIQ